MRDAILTRADPVAYGLPHHKRILSYYEITLLLGVAKLSDPWCPLVVGGTECAARSRLTGECNASNDRRPLAVAPPRPQRTVSAVGIAGGRGSARPRSPRAGDGGAPALYPRAGSCR